MQAFAPRFRSPSPSPRPDAPPVLKRARLAAGMRAARSVSFQQLQLPALSPPSPTNGQGPTAPAQSTVSADFAPPAAPPAATGPSGGVPAGDPALSAPSPVDKIDTETPATPAAVAAAAAADANPRAVPGSPSAHDSDMPAASPAPALYNVLQQVALELE
jgi:hypothetical protein